MNNKDNNTNKDNQTNKVVDKGGDKGGNDIDSISVASTPPQVTNNTSIKTINLTIPYIQQPFLFGTICWILGLCGGWIWTGMHYLGCISWPVIYYFGLSIGLVLAVIIIGLLILLPLGTMTKPDDASIQRFITKIKQIHKQNEELGWSSDLINPGFCDSVYNCDIDPIPVDWVFFKIAQVMNRNQFNRTKIYILGAFRGWYLIGW